MKPETHEDLNLALLLADEADKLTTSAYRTEGQPVSLKKDGSVLTKTDIEVDKAIRRILLEAMPDDDVLSEEHSCSDSLSSRRRWIIDPLDHTACFARGIPTFATLICLEVAQNREVAVVSAPALGSRWWAARGDGAYSNNGPLRVSATEAVPEVFCSIAGHPRLQDRVGYRPLREFESACRVVFGSGGFSAQMLLAEGRLDVVVEPWGEPWDIAAPALIVHEAGGEVTGLEGSPDLSAGVLFTNGRIHHTVVQSLNGASGERHGQER